MAKNITVSGLKFTPAVSAVFRTARLLNPGFTAETLARVGRTSTRTVGSTLTTLINYGIIEWAGEGETYRVTPKGYGLPVF